MRKLKMQMHLSLDGFVCGPNDEMDWITWNMDEELGKYITANHEAVDCILLGRVLAQGFIPAWVERLANPGPDYAFARKMIDTPKVVFSKTLQSAGDWANTTIESGDMVEAVTRLKQQPGGDIITYGGASFASALISHNLIDEYHFLCEPVALGQGKPIFAALQQKLKLKQIGAHPFACGLTVMHYEPQPTEKQGA